MRQTPSLIHGVCARTHTNMQKAEERGGKFNFSSSGAKGMKSNEIM